MAQSYVQVPADSVGKKVDTFETAGAQHRQVTVLGDPSTDANVISISSRLRLPVELEQLLDYDTGGGTANLSLVGLALPASGGPVAGGTATNPLRIDPTGVTTQPVSISGTITVTGGLTDTQLRASAVPVSVASLPLPSGAATEATLASALTALQLIDNIVSGSEAQVDVLTVPADPFGVNADAASASGSISAKLRQIATNGIPITGTVTVGSHAVTNAGVFVVQENGAALTALQLIDNIVSGSGVNISQINGVTPLMGAGATGTGSLRVTAASDSPEVTSLAIIDDWDETDRCKVNIIAGQVGVTAGAGAVSTNTPRITLASDDPAVVALQIIDNFISGSRGLVTEDNSAAIKTAVELIDNAISGAGFNITQFGGAAVPIGAGTEATAIRVTLPTNGTGVVGLAAGTSLVGRVNIDPQTGNGLSTKYFLDIDETHESIKASAGAVYGYHFVNRTTSNLYLKFYDHASPTVGTTAPLMTIELPANASDHIAGHLALPFGIAFATAITAAVTTGFADNDTGAPATNAVFLTVWYK